MGSSNTMTVSVVQAGSHLFDTPRTLLEAERLVRDAAGRGAELIVLPEAFVGGYPKGLDFGVRVGTRTDAGREQFRRYWASAVEVPGPETATLGALAADTGCHLVAGVVERAGATLYCTALFFGPTGALLGRHRKLMPTAAERVLWGFGDASTMPAVPAGKAVLGAAICWENYLPLFRAAMYAKGVTVWCAPTVDDRPSWQATMRHIATEGRCFVLSACQYLRRSQLPPDLHPPDGDGSDPVLIGGGSVIVSPLGEVLAGPAHDGETILVADIDLDDIPRARFDLDVTGHSARPDLFTLLVDERPRAVMRATGGDPGESGHDDRLMIPPGSNRGFAS